MRKHKWCLLTSGYGRSAISILNLQKDENFTDDEIALVVYDREPSGAFELAQEMGVPTVHIKKSYYIDRQHFENALLTECQKFKVDFIFLLGFNYLLGHSLLNAYNGRIVNVHPSLLPAFKGKRAIQQAIDFKVKVTGITTHLIDDKLDEGKIICQEPIRIDESLSFEEIDKLFIKAAPQVFKQTMLAVSRFNN